ncbi:SseB family protein [Microbacterium abyssi]|uniref:SseB family protein n=1 Tax=Microbacterium abyssi TaxID=2782166 RepID=UPI001888F336|nr:SseB family protein [Microbacterium sp. A18JL241]
MALFSRRKKTDDAPSESQTPIEADAAEDTPDAEQPTSELASESGVPEAGIPEVGISVQAFRGVGAAAGPEVALPDPDAAAPAPRAAVPQTTASARQAPQPPQTPQKRALPLAPALPPEQTESVPGMKDNVLLRAALAELEEGATNEQLIGVLRQMMQNHLYLRVHGDARTQLAEGKPLSIAVVRDGERSYMLAFSSAEAVRESVQRETEPTATSAIAQPVTAVLHQVVTGSFAGLILDNASGVHRAVFPVEVLSKALEQADVDMTIKMLLAAPREEGSAQKVGDALATAKMWVAVNDGSGNGQVGIAEAQTTDGRRLLQLFSHPLEIVALGRGDKPMPFSPEQLAKVLSGHSELAGVIVDSAGPSIIVDRSALGAVLVRAVDVSE